MSRLNIKASFCVHSVMLLRHLPRKLLDLSMQALNINACHLTQRPNYVLIPRPTKQ